MKTKLFITGSSGFIGFHVAKRYLDKGFKVRGFDSMNNYYDVKLKKSRLKKFQTIFFQFQEPLQIAHILVYCQ